MISKHWIVGILENMFRMLCSTRQVQSLVSTGVLNLMKDSFSVVALVGVMVYQNWKLALFAMLMMPLAAGLAKSLGKRIGKAVERLARRLEF